MCIRASTRSISEEYKIPLDASANVHSVSAIGEQYLDLVPQAENPTQFFSPGQTITKSSVPAEVGPTLDAANDGLAVLPKDPIAALHTLSLIHRLRCRRTTP